MRLKHLNSIPSIHENLNESLNSNASAKDSSIIVEENFITNVNEKEAYYIPYKAIGYAGKLKGFLGKQVRIREEGGRIRRKERRRKEEG